MKRPSLYLVGGILVCVIFVWLYLPTLTRFRELKSTEDKIRREIDDLNSKIADLEEERDLLKNDLGYIEKVIREELGLVKPDEIVYKFVEKEEENEVPVVGLAPQ